MASEIGKLRPTIRTVEERKFFKDAFNGLTKELCGRPSGKRGSASKSKNQTWWIEDVAQAISQRNERCMKGDGSDVIKENGGQPDVAMQHLYGQKKKTVRRAVDKAKREMEEELYRKLDEDSGKKMISKMAHEMDEDSKDVKAGTVIKHKCGKLVTERSEVLQVWDEYFKTLFNQTEKTELDLPSAAE